MHLRWIPLLASLAACGGEPISGTWRSDAIPTVVLELDDDGAGTLNLDGVVYVATATRVKAYRYTVERCSLFPESAPTCTEHACEFEDDDDPSPSGVIDDGPDTTVLVCEIQGRDRRLHAD